jgi:hypothetical protein
LPINTAFHRHPDPTSNARKGFASDQIPATLRERFILTCATGLIADLKQ